MRIALIMLVLTSLPRIGWAQAGAVERIAQLLEQQTNCFQSEGVVERRSLRILDSSQLAIPATSFRLAGLQRTSSRRVPGNRALLKRGRVSAIPGGISLPLAGECRGRASPSQPAS